MVSRRTVLKFGLGGAALFAAGEVGLALLPTKIVAPAEPLRILTAKQFSVLASVAEAVVGGGDLPTAAELRVAEKVDLTLSTVDVRVSEELALGLGLLESAAAGLLLDGRVRPFSQLSLERRQALLGSWRSARLAPLRSAFKAVHGFVSAAYWTSPEVFPAMGYPGPQPWLLATRTALLRGTVEPTEPEPEPEGTPESAPAAEPPEAP